jgi:predicted nucleotidyltransferase
MDSTILKKPPDNLQGMTKDEVVDKLKEKLKGRVSAAWIFGSFYTKNFGPFSDIDLILVYETDLPFVKRGMEFFDLRDWLPAIEPLVYTSGEFDKLTADPSVGFWQSVVQTMKKII